MTRFGLVMLSGIFMLVSPPMARCQPSSQHPTENTREAVPCAGSSCKSPVRALGNFRRVAAPTKSRQIQLRVTVAEVDWSQAEQADVVTALRRAWPHPQKDFSPVALLQQANTVKVQVVPETVRVSKALYVLRKHGQAKVLAEPVLVTLSGRQASFMSGGQIAVSNPVNNAVAFENIGLELQLTPVLKKDSTIYLDTVATVSKPGETANTIASWQMHTSTKLTHGQALVMMGIPNSELNNKRPATGLVLVIQPDLVKPPQVTNNALPPVVPAPAPAQYPAPRPPVTRDLASTPPPTPVPPTVQSPVFRPQPQPARTFSAARKTRTTDWVLLPDVKSKNLLMWSADGTVAEVTGCWKTTPKGIVRFAPGNRQVLVSGPSWTAYANRVRCLASPKRIALDGKVYVVIQRDGDKAERVTVQRVVIDMENGRLRFEEPHVIHREDAK